MDKPIRAPITLLLLILTGGTPAFTVYECIEQDGSVSFRDTCVPGTERVGSKQLRGARKVETVDVTDVAAGNPVVLYVAPSCNDACELVRNQLQNRKIPFREVDVTSIGTDFLANDIVGADGSVTVPTVMVAGQHITGYVKNELDSALNGVGYPDTVVED